MGAEQRRRRLPRRAHAPGTADQVRAERLAGTQGLLPQVIVTRRGDGRWGSVLTCATLPGRDVPLLQADLDKVTALSRAHVRVKHPLDANANAHAVTGGVYALWPRMPADLARAVGHWLAQRLALRVQAALVLPYAPPVAAKGAWPPAVLPAARGVA